MMRLSKNENPDISYMVKVFAPLKTKQNRIKHGSLRKIKSWRI